MVWMRKIATPELKRVAVGNEKRGERFLPPRPTSYFTFSTTSISMGSRLGTRSSIKLPHTYLKLVLNCWNSRIQPD